MWIKIRKNEFRGRKYQQQMHLGWAHGDKRAGSFRAEWWQGQKKDLGERIANVLGQCPRLNVDQSSLDFGKFKFNAVNLIQRLVLSYIGLCCVTRFDLSTLLNISAIVWNQHHSGFWHSCRGLASYFGWIASKLELYWAFPLVETVYMWHKGQGCRAGNMKDDL